VKSKPNKTRHRHARTRKVTQSRQTAPAAQTSPVDEFKAGDQLSDEDWVIYTQTESAIELLERRFSPAHPLARRGRNLLHLSNKRGESMFPPGQLRELRDAIYSLPEGLLREAFNGWKPERDWPTRQELEAHEAEMIQNPRPVLRVDVQPDGEIWTERTFKNMSGGLERLELYVREGLSRRETVAELVRLAAFVDEHWHTIVAEECVSAKPGTWNVEPLREGGGK
jgi:hypothetical protein